MKETAYIPLAQAYICPECDTLREGPGPCRCGQSQTVPVGRALKHPEETRRRKELLEAATAVFARGRHNLHNRLPEVFCRTCKEKLTCIEDCQPSHCPLGLKEGSAA